MPEENKKISCAICQPHYLPWIGYFEMISRVDAFVFLDDVKFIKREWKNRNRIRKSAEGTDTKWLTVPIAKESHDMMINAAEISTDWDWAESHINSLRSVYEHAPHFSEYIPGIKEIMENNSKGTLSDLNISLIRHISGLLGIKTILVNSSDIKAEGRREEKLLNICKTLGAGLYLANNATAEYVGEDYFQREGIDFKTQNYVHPQYEQKCKNRLLPFISHLSVVDLLFNQGPKSLEIIKNRKA